MKLQGLVFVAVVSFCAHVQAQNGSAPTLPGIVTQTQGNPGTTPLETRPLPLIAPPVVQAPTSNLEAEIKQFRNELRDFQAVREEVSRNAKSIEAESERSAIQQRQELLELMTKLAKKSMSRKVPTPAPPAPAKPAAPKAQDEQLDPQDPGDEPSSTVGPVDSALPPTLSMENLELDDSMKAADSFALGKVLFRTGDFAGAEKAFRQAVVSPENEMTLKYLLATCLRRQSRWKQSMEIYKAVSESNQDPVLRDLAKWQLDNIRWHQQSEAQLENIRKQREKKQSPSPKKSASVPANVSGR